MGFAECLQFAGDGKVMVHYSVERLESANVDALPTYMRPFIRAG
jgi:hypothetical protein